jgi:hypothetical protein
MLLCEKIQMKFILCGAFFWLAIWRANGQEERLVSPVSLSLQLNGKETHGVTSNARFSLNPNTHEFNALIDLFPIVPDSDVADSLAIKDKPLHFHLTGRFPPGDISFLTANEQVRSYAMSCQCRVYDSTKTCTLNFSLITLNDQPSGQDLLGTSHFQSRLSFVLIIIPSDFGLDQEPFRILQPVVIAANDAVINKVL